MTKHWENETKILNPRRQHQKTILHDYNQNESCYIADVNTHSHMWFTTSHDYTYIYSDYVISEINFTIDKLYMS